MEQMHGQTISLTPMRRMMVDFLRACQSVPTVAIERECRLAPIMAARQALTTRPSWFTLFLKAYSLVCERRPELRQAFLTFPWSRLYQSPISVASVAVAKTIGNDQGVLFIQIPRPEALPLLEIEDRIRRARNETAESKGTFRRQMRLARYPAPIRRLTWWLTLNAISAWRTRYAGTFGITGVSALGSTSLHTLTPLTSTLTFGVFEPDGRVVVRLFYDHRVIDGILPAEALRELEETLNGPIVEELLGTARQAA